VAVTNIASEHVHGLSHNIPPSNCKTALQLHTQNSHTKFTHIQWHGVYRIGCWAGFDLTSRRFHARRNSVNDPSTRSCGREPVSCVAAKRSCGRGPRCSALVASLDRESDEPRYNLRVLPTRFPDMQSWRTIRGIKPGYFSVGCPSDEQCTCRVRQVLLWSRLLANGGMAL
jgi:hypothetical protein